MNNLEVDALAEITEQLTQEILRGTPLSQLRGVSDAQMDNLYAFAHRFYEQGRLDEAQRFFHFLCI